MYISAYQNYDRKCKTCGNKFNIHMSPNYAYKRNSFYFCSYSCMTAYDNAQNKRKKKEEDL